MELFGQSFYIIHGVVGLGDVVVVDVDVVDVDVVVVVVVVNHRFMALFPVSGLTNCCSFVATDDCRVYPVPVVGNLSIDSIQTLLKD